MDAGLQVAWDVLLLLVAAAGISIDAAGVPSGRCSSFAIGDDQIVLYEGVPVLFNVAVLDQLCEDPVCDLEGTACQPGNCSVCVPITADYSKQISITADDVPESGSLPLTGVNCTVGNQSPSNLGYYPVTCLATNQLVSYGNVYTLTMTLMDPSNQSNVIAQSYVLLIFAAGKPVLPYTWAEWAFPPVGVYYRNELRLWLKDAMNNTVNEVNGYQYVDPVVMEVDNQENGMQSTMWINWEE